MQIGDILTTNLCASPDDRWFSLPPKALISEAFTVLAVGMLKASLCYPIAICNSMPLHVYDAGWSSMPRVRASSPISMLSCVELL